RFSPYAEIWYFFSSRRRHTRWPRDWSSDVCSSDLPGMGPAAHWVARRGNEVVAFAEVHFLEAENSAIGLTHVVVHPAARRSGIGTALLRAVLPELRARGRRIVEGWQVVAGTGGERWAEALGFRPVRTIVRQALVVAGAD